MKKAAIIFNYALLFFLVFSIEKFFAQSSSYKISGKVIIGGETRWDYLAVDESTNKLYTSHASKVHVIDLSTDKVIGEISDLTGVHGIAFAPEFNKGFISNRDGQVTIFDLKTYKKIESINVNQKNPDAIIYDASSKTVFTMNHSNNSVTAINPSNNSIIGTAVIQGVPEAAVTDGNGRLFVNLEDKDAIQVVDIKTMKASAKWSIAPCSSPTGMAIDLATGRLFTVGEKMMAILDIKTGKVIQTVAIGGGCDGCVFDAGQKLVLSSNGEGTMSVIKEENPNKFTVTATVTTAKGARTIALDSRTHRVFTLAAIDGEIPGSKQYGVLILDNK